MAPATQNEPRGYVTIYVDECKGCGLCVEACPPECLELLTTLSSYGVHPAHYTGEGCTGCGICFYACPEPGAITVYRAVKPPAEAKAIPGSPATQGAGHALAH